MRRGRKQTRGFTLLETVIISGMSIVIGTFLIGILVNHNGVYYKQSSLISEGLSLNEATRKIEENIKGAAAVAGSFQDGSVTYTTGSSTLVLKLPVFDNQGVIDGIYDYVVVTKDSANPKILRLLLFPDPQSSRTRVNTILTTLLDSLQIGYLDKNGGVVSPAEAATVAVSIGVLSKTGSIGNVRNASVKATLRNLAE